MQFVLPFRLVLRLNHGFELNRLLGLSRSVHSFDISQRGRPRPVKCRVKLVYGLDPELFFRLASGFEVNVVKL